MSKILRYTFFIILTWVLLSIGLVAADQNRGILLRFAHVSDTHISNSGNDTSRRLFSDSHKLLQDVVSQINTDTSLQFTIFTGDLVDYPTQKNLEDFVKRADQLNNGWYAALGNHDTIPKASLSKKEFIAVLIKHSIKFSETGDYSFLYGDKVKFIVLDGNKRTYNTAHGVFTKDQLNWFAKEVAAVPERFIVIALHYPIVEPFHSGTHHILEPYQGMLKQIIQTHKNILLVLAGHYHSAGIRTSSHTIHETCPAVIEYPNAFRIVTIYRDGTVQFEWRETSYKNLQEKSRLRSAYAKTAYGSVADRVNMINLYHPKKKDTKYHAKTKS